VPRKGEDIYTAVEAAEILGVNHSTVIRWVEAGLLRGSHLTEGAPWRIQLTTEDQQRLTATHVDEEWLPLKAAALVLGVSQQGVLQKLNSGEVEGKRVRVGRRSSWRIRLPANTYDNQHPLFDDLCG
jgi:excisionase family DNA binding protein